MDHPPPSEGTHGNPVAGAVENWAISGVTAPTEGRLIMTGAGNMKIGEEETCGNRQEGLNGD
jgi:hypothetical protein